MRVSIKFVGRDCWVGVFWATKYRTGFERRYENGRYLRWMETTVYICLIPCLPIIFTRKHSYKELW